MITATGDDLKLIKNDGEVWLEILFNNTHEATVIPLSALTREEGPVGVLLIGTRMSMVLTRCTTASTSVFTPVDVEGKFALGATINEVSLRGTGARPTMRSNRYEAEDYLTMLVYNINIILLNVHGMVVPTTEATDPTDWLSQD